MQADETVLLVDNNTVAGCGRCLYQSNPSSKGGQHAATYYRLYPDAELVDGYSLLELLTGVVLFDRLLWDASSDVQEQKEFDSSDIIERMLWVHDWFPALSEHIRPVWDHFSVSRVCNSARLAMHWVLDRLRPGAFKLPKGFKVPMAYLSPDYKERRWFDLLNEEYQLTQAELPVAMFLHRGLYYQSSAHHFTGMSYMPHAYRAMLLTDVSLSGLGLLCDCSELFRLRTPSGFDLAIKLDGAFYEELEAALGPQRTKVGMTLGLSFIRRAQTPMSALDAAVRFKDSRAGLEVRARFRELLRLFTNHNRAAVNRRLAELRKELRSVAVSEFGSALEDESLFMELLDLTSVSKAIGKPLLRLVPLRLRESVSRWLHSRVAETGFQVLFKYHLRFARECAALRSTES